MNNIQTTTRIVPDENGRFGAFGGKFIPETLMNAVTELEIAFEEARRDPAFVQELNGLLSEYAGRPTPLTYAERLTNAVGGA
ncbi:tryptophan synthase subunit beta, partial [Brevibacillus sp. NRRL NRS-603]